MFLLSLTEVFFGTDMSDLCFRNSSHWACVTLSALSSKPLPSPAPCRGAWCRRALVVKLRYNKAMSFTLWSLPLVGIHHYCNISVASIATRVCGAVQIAGLLSSLVVLLVVVAIGFVFEPLPQVGSASQSRVLGFLLCRLCAMFFICSVCLQTALASIIMVNLVGMFKQLRDIPALWRSSKIELVSRSGSSSSYNSRSAGSLNNKGPNFRIRCQHDKT